MKKIAGIIALLVSFCASAQMGYPERPNPPRLVNDFTNTLQPEQVQALEQKLIAYDDSTSNQVVVVIVSRTGEYSIEDLALEILRKWGVGSKTNNNGIVLLVAKDDRKVTMQIGYGLEGAIPDLTAKSIIDNEVTPNFKAGNYYRGIDEAIDDIMKAAAGQYKAPAGYGQKKSRGIGIGAIIFFVIFLIIAFSSRGGSGGGGMASRRGFRDFGAGWLIGTLLSGGGSGGGWSGGGGG
ncbi:MAG TPA: TPM domain-containing protein, partial [Chitinophagaceae bacterium]|nr:TPM domain-containing protein [Chitinophagaceae bacterium]